MSNDQQELHEPKRPPGLGSRFVKGLGSFWLACLCLFMLFLLTIFGTLYQVDHGLYAAKKVFFGWDFAPMIMWGRTVAYLPGTATVLAVLSLNLTVGGILRIRWTWKNAGIIIIHFGIIYLIVAGLVKMTSGKEGHLRLWEGDQRDFFTSFELWEVSVWEQKGGNQGAEFIIPDEHFTDLVGDATRKFTSPHLPFELTLGGFVKNCDVMPKGPMWEATGEVIDNYGIRALAPEKDAEFNAAGMHAEVRVDGQVQRGILHGMQRVPWVIEADGRRFAIDMRHMRYPMPFDVRLEKFTKEDYPGMTMAKTYESLVTRIDESGEERVLIQMNEPLREDGLVLFQTSYGPQRADGSVPPGERLYSVFSAVDNPSDKWPEYSMWVIALGLVITFGRTLLRYISKQNANVKKLATEKTL